jgi:hypothetical protein
LDCFLAIAFQSMSTLFKSSKIIVGHKVGDIDISLVVEVSTQELSKINVGGLSIVIIWIAWQVFMLNVANYKFYS